MVDWKPFLYGGLASCIAECGTFPIDTTKTRLQVQGQRIDVRHSELRYRGMTHALSRIVQEEGIRALYSGISPALLRQATYGTLKIGFYHGLKRSLVSNPQDETLLINGFCGVVAGILSSAIANPTDVLKVRLQAKGRNGNKENLFQAYKNIYQKEGLHGLWRGVGPTSQRAAVVAGVELPVYDISKKHIIRSGFLDDNKYTHFIASFIAGLSGAIASTPIDVVKTRLMNQKKLKATVIAESGGAIPAIYTSSMDCLLQTVRTEGFMALYKGFVPTWVRLGPWNIIFFMSLEQLMKLHH